MMRFQNRRSAGRELARQLTEYADPPPVVLALPRGGVPVAFEVARELNAPLELCLVRKLGVPGRPELAMGAIAEGGACVMNQDVVTTLGISEEDLEVVAAIEEEELARQQRLYRGARTPPDVHGRTAILVDDGLATGATMRAAIEALRLQGAARIVAAAPVGSPDTCADMAAVADDVVCVKTPEPLFSVGSWYDDFSATSDREVVALLSQPQTVARQPSFGRTAGARRRIRPSAFPRTISGDNRWTGQ